MQGKGSQPVRQRRSPAKATAPPGFLSVLLTGFLLAPLAAACGSGSGGGVAVPSPAGTLPAPGMAWVIFGTDTIHAEVASTPAAREKGLMGRDAVPAGTGMLFVFPGREERLVWMKDTDIALDLAVFDEGNRVVAIKQLEPLDESLTDTEAATALLLEVPRGWFAERGIEVGAVAEVVFAAGMRVS